MTEIIITSSVLIVFLIVLRYLLRGRIHPTVQHALWLLVAARLLIPGTLFTAPVSVMGATDGLQTAIESTFHIRNSTGTNIPVYTIPDYIPPEKEEDHGDTVITYYPPEATHPAPVKVINWSDVIWKTGIALAGSALLLSNLTFYNRLQKKRRLLAPGDLPHPCRVPIYVVEGLPSPCLFGLIRPAIYVNQEALAPQRLEHILTHEETHLRHGDHLWALLRSLCLVIHWYNPLVWWAASLSRRDCELSCDAAAIHRLGEAQRIVYGQTLLSMVVLRTSPADLLRTATTMTAGKRTMKERIQLIAKAPKMLKITLIPVILTACVAAVLVFGGAAEDSVDTGQAGSTATDSAEDAPAITRDTVSTPLTEAAAIELYHQAREVWNWFERGTIPTTGAPAALAGETYLTVQDFTSIDDLRTHLCRYFSSALADHLLNDYAIFRESGNKLYVLPVSRTPSIHAGKETVTAFPLTGEEAAQQGYDCHIYSTTEVLDFYDEGTVLYQKRHDWYMAWNGQNHVFTSFGPTDDVDPQKYYNALTILQHYEDGAGIITWLPMVENLDWNAVRATRDQWPEGFDLSMYILISLSEYVAGESSLTAAQMVHILSATEGLDGAYSEQFQFIVYELYRKAPSVFAYAVLDGSLSANGQAAILDFFRFEEPYHRAPSAETAVLSREEAAAMLQTVLSEGLSASPGEMTFTEAGQKAQFLPISAYGVYAASYTSSDPSVATVDELGFVEAIGPGKAIITLHYEGAGGQKDFTCTVTCEWEEGPSQSELYTAKANFKALVENYGNFGLIEFLEGRESWNTDDLLTLLAQKAHSALVGSPLESHLDRVVISESFTFPKDPQSGQTLQVPVTYIYRITLTDSPLPLRVHYVSSQEMICEIGLYEEGGAMPEWMFYNLVQSSKGEMMTHYTLEQCADFSDGLAVPVSEEFFDVNTYIRDTVLSRLKDEGIDDAWIPSIIECGSYRSPSHEPPGTEQTISYGVTFSPLGGNWNNYTVSSEIIVTTIE